MKYGAIRELLPQEVATARNAQLVEKAMRDARLLREHARLVIVLDYTETNEVACREVIDNSSSGYIADVIAILAPVRLWDGAFVLDQGLVFEIGMSRGRPYRQAETWEHPQYPDQKLHIKRRRRQRDISLEELEAAWLPLATHLRVRTEKRQKERKEKTFAVHGGSYIHNDGVRITVSKNDSIMYYKVVLEDTRSRQERYLRRRVQWIVETLRPYRSSRVTGKRFKRLKGVAKVADSISNMRRLTYAPNHLMRALVRAVPRDMAALFERVLVAHGLSKLHGMTTRDPGMPQGLILAKRLPMLHPGRLWIVRKQGNQPQRRGRHRRVLKAMSAQKQSPHAKGCVVAEHYLLSTPS